MMGSFFGVGGNTNTMNQFKTSFYAEKGGIDMNFISQCLPDFIPIKTDKSSIIDEAGIRLITMYLPPLIRMREWNLLFSIDNDGISINTFYSKTDDRDHTVTLILTEFNEVFGFYMTEAWHKSNKFYGCVGDGAFVFNFERTKVAGKTTTESINYYDPTFKNDHY